jgi:hypothetical protein
MQQNLINLNYIKLNLNYRKEGKATPGTSRGGPQGCETSGLWAIGSHMAVRLSVTRADRPLPQENVPVLIMLDDVLSPSP